MPVLESSYPGPSQAIKETWTALEVGASLESYTGPSQAFRETSRAIDVGVSPKARPEP